jgi:putative ABC transport system permease protein
MNFSESLKQAFDSLKSNKLRSILTMLGIIMGVFSVITIVAIGNAAEAHMNVQFEKIGANTINITYKTRNIGQSEMLTLEDMETVKKVSPEIKNIATYIQRSGTLRVGENTRDAVALGVSSQYRNFDVIELIDGRFVNDFDISARAKVIVVDEFFAQKYFNRTDVVGESVSFKTSWGSNTSLKIVGVKKGGDDLFSSMLTNDQIPAIVYMPISTLQNIFFNSKALDSMVVSVEDKDTAREVGNRIVKVLNAKHGKDDLYMAQNTADIQETVNSILGVVSAVLLAIAAITLVVGGIGIINILLVSVTERIREIGIRKALGARKRDIILQFITESIIMTSFSGIIGIILGILAGMVIAKLIKIPPVVNIAVVILAFLGSIGLGLIFGVYPAKKAADLDPIESLRYE